MALLSHWKLIDLTDEQSLHDIVNTGNADQVADGYDFEAASSEYMTVTDTGNDYDFGANEAFTWVTWFKCRDTGSNKIILAKYDGTDGFYINLLANGIIDYRIKSTGGTLFSLTSDNTYEDNAWHMLAIRRVASSSTIKLWIDDGIAEDKSASATAGSIANGTNLYIGRYSVSAASYFDGVMGNGGGASRGILAYDTELSDGVLGALYAAAAGWDGKYIAVTDPAALLGIEKTGVLKIDGVVSS